MASRIEGFDEKILSCAKEEFLAMGFEKASLLPDGTVFPAAS